MQNSLWMQLYSRCLSSEWLPCQWQVASLLPSFLLDMQSARVEGHSEKEGKEKEVAIESRVKVDQCHKCHNQTTMQYYVTASLVLGCATFITDKTEYIRARVYNSVQWNLSRQTFDCIINDAQPLSFQVVMNTPLNTCMLAHAISSIFLTNTSGWVCSLQTGLRQCTVVNVDLSARG